MIKFRTTGNGFVLRSRCRTPGRLAAGEPPDLPRCLRRPHPRDPARPTGLQGVIVRSPQLNARRPAAQRAVRPAAQLARQRRLSAAFATAHACVAVANHRPGERSPASLSPRNRPRAASSSSTIQPCNLIGPAPASGRQPGPFGTVVIGRSVNRQSLAGTPDTDPPNHRDRVNHLSLPGPARSLN